MISTALSHGTGSWYITYRRNKTERDYPVYGSYQQSMNTSWLNGDMTEGDQWDKTGYGWSTGGRTCAGMAPDRYSVAAQGLEGAIELINEPYEDDCKFRFVGDPGARYVSAKDASGLNTKHYCSKRIECYTNRNLPAGTGKIVSFVVTKEDGVRYVFADPVYVVYYKVSGSPRLSADLVTKDDGSIMHSYYKWNTGESPRRGYAIAWLLSAVLYPDYVPSDNARSLESSTPENAGDGRGDGIRQDLLPDQGSKGNWVKFRYGQVTDFYLASQVYKHSGVTSAHPDAIEYDGEGVAVDGEGKTVNRVAKEIYVLRSVETNTHVAVLNYSKNRTDSWSSYDNSIRDANGVDRPATKLTRLDELVLLKKDDVTQPSQSTPLLWDSPYTYQPSQIVGGWRFGFSQELCRGIPNSDNNGDGAITADDVHLRTAGDPMLGGKLTLKDATQFGRGMAASMPPYKFEYYNTGTWGKYKWDRWGTYKENGVKQNHLVDFGATADNNAKQFCLRSIGLPTGGKMEIDYEAKKYLKVGRYDYLTYEAPGSAPWARPFLSLSHESGRVRGGVIGSEQSEFCVFAAQNVTIASGDYATNPDDEIEVVHWLKGGSDSPDNTEWLSARQFAGKSAGVSKASYNRSEDRWEVRYRYKAVDQSSLTIMSMKAHNTHWNYFYEFGVWKYAVGVDVVVHHPGVTTGPNGSQITAANPKCGDGARVKSVTYTDGLGQSIVKQYSYEDWENGNRCSGAASLEPPSLTKDVKDILEMYDDARNSYKPGPFVVHSHVVVREPSGIRRYKFNTPYLANDDEEGGRSSIALVKRSEVPDPHRFQDNAEMSGVDIHNSSGAKLGSAVFYRKTIPYVLVDRMSFVGKPVLVELLNKAENKVISSTQYFYKNGFDKPAAADRTAYTRQVLGVDNTISTEENYFVHSVGPIHGIKDGSAFGVLTDTRADDLMGSLAYYQVYPKSINLVNDYLAPGNYYFHLSSGYLTNYMFKYDVMPVLDRIITTTDGVEKTIRNDLWDAKTSMAVRTTTTGGGAASDIVNEQIPAYHKYAAMDNTNMLTQVVQTTVYRNTAAPDNAVSSNVTTWVPSNEIPSINGIWRIHASHAWRKNMTSAGLPTGSFTDYVFSTADDATNPDWVRTSEVERYTASSQPAQTKDAAGTRSVIIYDKNSVYQNAAIANAALSECIFTSWEDRTDADIIKTTGTTAAIVTTNPHSGTKCLKVAKGTAVDPAPQVRTETTAAPGTTASRKIRWEFWVRADASCRTFSSLRTPQNDVYGGFTWIDVTPTWQKFSFEELVPAGKSFCVNLIPPAIPGPVYQAGNIYYDDVRAYPANALMTSYTYDPVLGVPTSATDANNNTTKTTYDGFGRVTAQYNTKGQKVKEFKYHLANDNDPPPVPVSGTKSGNTLSWSCGTDPDGDAITYNVEINAVDDYDGLYLSTVWTGTSTTKSVTPSGVPAPGLHIVYVWKVKSVDARGAVSAWSESWIYEGSFAP